MNTQEAKTERLERLLGERRKGELVLGGVPVSALADQVGTPFYVYSGEALITQARRVHEALGPEIDVYFSLKANPSLGICQLLAREGLGAEVASIGELLLARQAGFPTERTLFAGQGKTDEELCEAARLGLQAVNAESEHELERMACIASRLDKTVRVGLRVNPIAQMKGAQMRMGGGPQQFGIDEEKVPEVLDRYRDHPHLRVVGLHVYAGTQIFDVEALLAHCRHVADLGRNAAERLGRPLEVLDFGGGLGVPYFEGLSEFDLHTFGKGLRELVRECRREPGLASARLVVEPGRYLVAEAGVYVVRVVDVKWSRNKRFVVTDGGMNHHIMATGNFGQVFRRPYPLAALAYTDSPATERCAVVGPRCTPLDVFGQDLALPHVREGDLLGVFYSGAYGYSASSLAFLSHPSPAEVLVWRGHVHVLRGRGRPDQVLEGQRGLDS